MSMLVPFGPQHPVLPEPLQLRLEINDEKVISAVPVIGYIHRGLEKLAEEKDFQQDVFLIERVCGICSFIHSLTYCSGIEELMDIKVPERARFLRVAWSELHRMHSHLLAMGLLADAFGFENLFYQLWKVRELVMDAMEATTGARIMLGSCCIGGVRKDIDPTQAKFVLDTLSEVERQLKQLLPVLLEDYSVKSRLVGIGHIDAKSAFESGAVGPALRGSGVKYDYRMTGYAAYKELNFEPVIAFDGDCYARTQVRVGELYQSIDLVRQVLGRLPDTPLATPFKGKPNGEVVVRAEQPRGEVLYYMRANGTDKLERLRVRTPTFANIAPLMNMLVGCNLSDVAVIILSIDPCVSCTER